MDLKRPSYQRTVRWTMQGQTVSRNLNFVAHVLASFPDPAQGKLGGAWERGNPGRPSRKQRRKAGRGLGTYQCHSGTRWGIKTSISPVHV